MLRKLSSIKSVPSADRVKNLNSPLRKIVRQPPSPFKLGFRRTSTKPRSIALVVRSYFPKVDKEIRELIRRISRENPLWGVPRIPSELRLVGYDVAESTVAKYRVWGAKPPSQSWRTFLENHIGQIASVDFFTVPTITFRVFFCFLALLHDRRRVVHFNVTQHPTAPWTGQQVMEAFPEDTAPRYLLRNRDKIYGANFIERIEGMDIQEVLTAPRSPWQRAFVERLIGSVRQECLNHVIVLGEDHLRRILRAYFRYYHESRTHLSWERNSPVPRKVELPAKGRIIAIPQVGGLHHRFKETPDDTCLTGPGIRRTMQLVPGSF